MEYQEVNGEPEGDPITELHLNQKFIGDTYQEELTKSDKKMYLKSMLDRFYNNICQEMGLD